MTFQTNPFSFSNDGGLHVSPSETSRDAFGRLRISTPYSLFAGKFVNNSGQIHFTDFTSNGGTYSYSSGLSTWNLEVPTTSGARSLRQSRKYLNYSPGYSQLIYVTTVFDEPKEHLVQRVGYFDDNNGFFFEASGTTNSVVLRSDTSGIFSERRIPQNEWNLDKLDGSGTSEFNLDVSLGNIYLFDMQWLGVGQIRCGVVDSNGEVVYAHRFINANLFTAPYIRTPNLPVRWEILNAQETSSSSVLRAICCAVFSDNSVGPLLSKLSTDNGALEAVTTTEEIVLAIRLKPSNRAIIIPKSASLLNTTNNHVVSRIYIGTEPPGLTWVDYGDNVQKSSNNGVTTIPSNSIQIGTLFVSSQNRSTETDLSSVINITSDYIGSSNVLFMTARALLGNPNPDPQVYCSLTWEEVL